MDGRLTDYKLSYGQAAFGGSQLIALRPLSAELPSCSPKMIATRSPFWFAFVGANCRLGHIGQNPHDPFYRFSRYIRTILLKP